MNKTAIKNFAIWARVQLIEAAKQRAYEYEITEKGENKSNLDAVAGRLLTSDEKQQRQQLIEQIRRKGYAQVMEEAAYTWFNRFIALRFMEVNGFLPSKVRLFTDENGAFKPEIMKEAMTVEIDGLDRAKVLDLLDKQNNEELYKYLLITQCNALNQGLPYMFEKISNWTELLFPANLLRPDSVVGQMVSEIPEEDWQDAVQIIGWMYQYYNSELKDDTFALLKKNVKITKERIPAATQLFTPDWIVRYMVENSLGRLWYEGHPSFDKSEWKYYLDEAPQEPEVELQLKKIRADYASINPEDIKVIDPCMGSGHILVYAFDVLLQIYTSCGWSERDAAKSIVENNLYGLDIDDRAGQLAYFAVMMKARKYSRRILNGETKPNVLAIQDSGFITDDFIDYVAQKDQHMKADLTLLRSSLKDAKEYGSILHMPKLSFAALYERIDIISRSFAEDIFQIEYQRTATEQLLPLVKQAEIMAQKYDVVVTNPPYMGNSGFSSKLSDYAKENYPNSKNDLYSIMIERCIEMSRIHGLTSMITMQSWVNAPTFKALRKHLFSLYRFENLVNMGSRGFEEIQGEKVKNTIFTIANNRIQKWKPHFVDLTDVYGENEKRCLYLSGKNRYAYSKQEDFCKTESCLIVYKTVHVDDIYSPDVTISDVSEVRRCIATGDDETYLRSWFEVQKEKIYVAGLPNEKWFFVANGGERRRWYGNNLTVLNWENDGKDIRVFNDRTKKATLRNVQYMFQDGATYTYTSMGSGIFNARVITSNMASLGVGPVIVQCTEPLEMISYVNSVVFRWYWDIMYGKVSTFETGNVGRIVYKPTSENREIILENTLQCISNSQKDWDSFETSWDFKKHPLV